MSSTSPIVTSLSPNTEPDDIRLARRLLVSPGTWPSFAPQLAESAAAIATRVRQPHVTLTSSARAALYEALRAGGIGDGDEVIIQAFTCLAVPAAIAWAGARPIYADIVADAFNFSAATVRPHITPQTKAIVIQHTFGIPAPLPELIALAREHKLLIIEDLAHGLGGDYDGQPLGSFGDLAIMSFGRDKTISSVFGGAVATANQNIHNTIQKNMAEYQEPPASWLMQQLLHPLIVNLAIPLYFTGPLGKIILVTAQKMGLVSMAVSVAEKRGEAPIFLKYRFAQALAPLLALQLSKLERFTTHRRLVAARYQQALGLAGECSADTDGATWLRFPVLVARREELKTAAQHYHILLGDWYTTPVAPLSLDHTAITQYFPGSCPNAEHVTQSIVNLPTHPRITENDSDRIIACVKPFV